MPFARAAGSSIPIAPRVGLAAAAAERGAQLYEGSLVRRIRTGKRQVEVLTERARAGRGGPDRHAPAAGRPQSPSSSPETTRRAIGRDQPASCERAAHGGKASGGARPAGHAASPPEVDRARIVCSRRCRRSRSRRLGPETRRSFNARGSYATALPVVSGDLGAAGGVVVGCRRTTTPPTTCRL